MSSARTSADVDVSDAGAARAMMSPKRQALLDQIYEVDGVTLRQANAIASELCTSITFTSQLLLGEHGFGGAAAVPALGNSWHHCVSTRLVLEHFTTHRQLTITKSPIEAIPSVAIGVPPTPRCSPRHKLRR